MPKKDTYRRFEIHSSLGKRMVCASIVSRHVGTEDTAAQCVVIKARVQCHV